MYIWRKRAGPAWLRDGIEPLTQRCGSRLVLVERPGNQRVLLEISCRSKQQAHKLVREFGGSVEKLQPDWLQDFARNARSKPLRIGARLVILDAPSKRSDLTPTLLIPAEAAFGTGHHPTTAMCVRLLERITRRFTPGWRMLDAGTGSGILALAASRFGAARVLAIDNDPLACSIAKRNARANRAQNIEFITGEILKHKLPRKIRHHYGESFQRNSDQGIAGLVATSCARWLPDSLRDPAGPGKSCRADFAPARFRGRRGAPARKMDRPAL